MPGQLSSILILRCIKTLLQIHTLGLCQEHKSMETRKTKAYFRRNIFIFISQGHGLHFMLGLSAQTHKVEVFEQAIQHEDEADSGV